MKMRSQFYPVEFFGFFIRWSFLKLKAKISDKEFESFNDFKNKREWFLDLIIGCLTIIIIIVLPIWIYLFGFELL